MSWQKIVLGIVVLIVAVVTWMGRYDIIGGGANGDTPVGVAYRLDRWTGNVILIVNDSSIDVKKVEN